MSMQSRIATFEARNQELRSAVPAMRGDREEGESEYDDGDEPLHNMTSAASGRSRPCEPWP
jgi:hypothetical protein